MVDGGGLGAPRHVLLLAERLAGGHLRIVQHPVLGAAEREAARDADGADGVQPDSGIREGGEEATGGWVPFGGGTDRSSELTTAGSSQFEVRATCMCGRTLSWAPPARLTISSSAVSFINPPPHTHLSESCTMAASRGRAGAGVTATPEAEGALSSSLKPTREMMRTRRLMVSESKPCSARKACEQDARCGEAPIDTTPWRLRTGAITVEVHPGLPIFRAGAEPVSGGPRAERASIRQRSYPTSNLGTRRVGLIPPHRDGVCCRIVAAAVLPIAHVMQQRCKIHQRRGISIETLQSSQVSCICADALDMSKIVRGIHRSEFCADEFFSC